MTCSAAAPSRRRARRKGEGQGSEITLNWHVIHVDAADRLGRSDVTHIDYDVVMSKRAATPVRFDPPVAERLAAFVAGDPRMSLSSAANRLVDESLRMAEHPGVIFRSGSTGRRAALAGGPDVWEVIRAIKSAHAAEPGLNR